MKKPIWEIAFALLALLICAVLMLGMAAFGPSQAGANERLAGAPKLLVKEQLNPELLSDTADYLSDRFFLRQELITLRSRLMALLGSSAVEDVVLGRDGWLYYADTLEDYTGAAPLSEEALACAAENLALMQEYCRSLGARFLFVPVPNKNSLYPEAMPAYAPAASRDLERFLPLLAEKGVPCVDLAALFAAREETLYFAHDSHWDARGAALGADAINTAFGRPSGYFSGPFRAGNPHDGDLYAMLFPASADPETDWDYVPGLRYTRAGSDTRPDSITIRTTGEGSGVLLAFRDSFGNSLYPYLADSFAQACFSRATAYPLTQAAELGADFVLVELVERNLADLLENIPVMPAPERALPESAGAGGTLRLTGTSGGAAPEGCILWEGMLPETGVGPVVLRSGARSWEAFRLEEGRFAAYLPEDAAPEQVLFLRETDPLAWTAETIEK